MESLYIKDLSGGQVQALIAEHGNISKAAKYLFNNFQVHGRDGRLITKQETVRTALGVTAKLAIAGREDPNKVSRIEKLLANHNVPQDQIQRIENVKIGLWGIHAKNANGDIVKSYLDKTQVTLVPEAPPFPVVHNAEPCTILFDESRCPRLLRDTYQVVVVSDVQAGFYKQRDGSLQSIHDEVAVSIAQTITKDVAPRKLMFIGDVCDWQFISRWQMHPEFMAAQESVDVAHEILCNFISAAGPQVIEKRMIDSNHAQRPEKFMLEYNMAAMGLRRAGETSKWPTFSEPWFLNYEKLGIDMDGRYPGEDYFLLDKLVLLHAPPKAKEFEASVLHGHTHHCRATPRVSHGRNMRSEYTIYDIGCLTSVGQNADRMSLMVTRTPSNRGRTDWNQGMAVVNVVAGKEDIFTVDLIRIKDHCAMYGGQLYGKQVG